MVWIDLLAEKAWTPKGPSLLSLGPFGGLWIMLACWQEWKLESGAGRKTGVRTAAGIHP